MSKGGYMTLVAALILIVYGGYIWINGGDRVIAGSYLAVGAIFALMLLIPRRKR